jgi:hypothetical protein
MARGAGWAGLGLILQRKIETTKNTKVHESQRVEARMPFTLRVKAQSSAGPSPFVLFRGFRGLHFGI